MIQRNRKIYCVFVSEELILLKCSYYPKQSTDLMHSLSNAHDIFHITRKNNPKIHIEPKIYKDPKLLKQSWEKKTKLKVSHSLTSDYTTKLE